MKRREFTINLSKLIQYANEELKPLGYWVVLDYVKRSDEEQKRLFDAGKSHCDGYNVRSRHQLGQAADLYVIGVDGMVDDPMKTIPDTWRKIRAYWEELGGDRMISWDAGHFE
jgi:hypothetical protein